MKRTHKALLLTVCAIMLVVESVFGTIAYLTDTDSVQNTFTVGSVGLNLDEAKTDAEGNAVVPAERTEAGNKYHLLPGHTYVKDPTVTVDADSDEAYVRMMVEVEGYANLKTAFPAAEYWYNGEVGGMFLLEKLCAGWDRNVWVMTSFENGVYEFRYYKTVNTIDAKALELEPLFETITVPGTVDNDQLNALAAVEINATAHAIQADGFDTADLAWAQFK